MAKCRFSYECRECKEVTLLDLELDDVQRWKEGALIQNVFPQLSENVRELMISGICGDCFDDLFADEQPSEFDEDAPAF